MRKQIPQVEATDSSLLTGTGNCPFCKKELVLGYCPTTKVVVPVPGCVHFDDIIITDDNGALVSFTATTTIKMEVN